MNADVVIVGGGLAGLTAACELAEAGRKTILVDQEGPQNLGGQAYWSFGGLFFVDSPEQRRLGIRDSIELARQDWMGSAGFDRDEDHWPKRWAEAYLAFAAGPKRAWLRELGLKWMPVVNWAERGGYGASGPGNSVPRFHITWGTGPGLLAPFVRRYEAARHDGLVRPCFRHRMTELVWSGGRITGVRGEILEPSCVPRGARSSRSVTGEFTFTAGAVILATGGFGGNHDLVRRFWPDYLGSPPDSMISGVPDHVDGSGILAAEAAGAQVINLDRSWHYTEGVREFEPLWSSHGVRVLSGPSPLWLSALGERLPPPLFPGFDTLGTLRHISKSGFDHSWMIFDRNILEREIALSGSRQNPGLTAGNWWQLIKARIHHPPGPVASFLCHGADFITEDRLEDLVARMNKSVGRDLLDADRIRGIVEARDRETRNAYGKDAQVAAIRSARGYLGDRWFRACRPHAILAPDAGPLTAVRLGILTRKTLGGVATDLAARALDADGQPIENLFAVGEAAGFGGGGMHGYRALEGAFLGGCLFSGRAAARSAAALTR